MAAAKPFMICGNICETAGLPPSAISMTAGRTRHAAQKGACCALPQCGQGSAQCDGCPLMSSFLSDIVAWSVPVVTVTGGGNDASTGIAP